MDRRDRGDGFYQVALLAEGVDRNSMVEFCPLCDTVALLAEGVDRNKGESLVTSP